MMYCLKCGSKNARDSYKYCSNQCQMDYQYDRYIERWKLGKETGVMGVSAQGISGHIRRYILKKYKFACSRCGWNRKNPVTGKSPLELDHLDGNFENNIESNLQILCPNCHSLTPNYKNLNKGNGRNWRRLKYIKNA